MSRRPRRSRMASVPGCLRRGLRRAMHRELPANALPGVRSPLASHVTTGTSEVPSVKQLGTESTDHRGRTGRRRTVQEARPPPSRENPRLWVDAPRLRQKTENKHRTSDETESLHQPHGANPFIPGHGYAAASWTAGMKNKCFQHFKVRNNTDDKRIPRGGRTSGFRSVLALAKLQ